MASVTVFDVPVVGTRSAPPGRTFVPCLLAAAAGLHLWAANVHGQESRLLALGFVGVAALQLWAATVLTGAAGRAKVAIVTGNLLAVGVWCLSRLVGLPFGPHAGVPEAVSTLDALTVAVEVAALTGVVLLPARSAGGAGGVRRLAPRMLVACSCLVAVGVGAALGGGADHHAEAPGRPSGAEVPAADQPVGALFQAHPEGHEGVCDLFHPCPEGAPH